MKLATLGFLAITILVTTSCQKESSKTTDAQLIEAIQKATNKQNIDIGELPAISQETLENEYVDDNIDGAKLAPELGYEVDLVKLFGSKASEFKQAYFNLSGRELKGDKGGSGDKGDNDKRKCFELVYPVTYIMLDGTEITVVTNDDEGWAEVKAWYAAHPDVKKRPEIQFPVDIKWHNGRVITINNRHEMHRAKRRCKGDGGDKERCFEFVYPVTYIMPDDTEIIVNGEDDGSRAEIRAWYAAHPDVKKRPEIKFPVNIKYKKNDAIKTINNREELRRAYEACKDKD